MPAAVPDEAILQFPPPSASFPLSLPLDRRSVVRPLEQGGKRVQIGIVWVDAMRCRDSIRAEESVQAQAARRAGAGLATLTCSKRLLSSPSPIRERPSFKIIRLI